MTITHKDVADLQPGDVVEYRREEWPAGAVVRAPLEKSPYDGGLFVLNGQLGVVGDDGTPHEVDGDGTRYRGASTLTVVSRAPRPLYVNHPRTEPVAGDVAQGGDDGNVFLYRPARGFDEPQWWFWDGQILGWTHGDAPTQLRLLVDGETGQVVP